MEPEYSGGITAAFDKLEQDVIAYLNSKFAASPSDQAGQFLWSGGKEIKCPPAYLMYRKLKLYAGREGNLPFLWSGGYADQPYLASLTLERCIESENTYRTIAQATMPASGSGNGE